MSKELVRQNQDGTGTRGAEPKPWSGGKRGGRVYYGTAAELGDELAKCMATIRNLHKGSQPLGNDIDLHMATLHLEKAQEKLDLIIGRAYRKDRPRAEAE